MEWLKWAFDGIGSQLVGIIIGLLIGSIGGGIGGCFLGYRIVIKNKINQKQKGGKYANQIQIGSINNVNGNDSEKRK